MLILSPRANYRGLIQHGETDSVQVCIIEPTVQWGRTYTVIISTSNNRPPVSLV